MNLLPDRDLCVFGIGIGLWATIRLFVPAPPTGSFQWFCNLFCLMYIVVRLLVELGPDKHDD